MTAHHRVLSNRPVHHRGWAVNSLCLFGHWALRHVVVFLVVLLGAQTVANAQTDLGVVDRPTYVAAALPTEEQLREQRYRNSIALHAQLLCSGVFVSGRAPQAVIAEDLQWREYYFHDWKTTQWSVDREQERVVLRAPASEIYGATPNYTAVHTPGLGCTLLPVGAERTAFSPVNVKTQLPPAANIAWPMGDKGASGDTANTDKMDTALDAAFNDTGRDAPQNTRAVIVLHKGKIVGERYAPGVSETTPLLGWSMGKSVAAILFGIYAKDTGLDVDDPAPIADWRHRSDPRSRITSRHLLNMAAGLKFHNPSADDSFYYTELHDHESVYFRGQNTEALVIKQPLLYEPGSVFQYRNTNTLALMSIIKRGVQADGGDHLAWPRERLFDKIGARSFVLEPDAFGNFVITGFDYATARDWARLGQFALQDGVWEGERLWPRGWRKLMAEPSAAYEGYGGQVWLNRAGVFPSVPKDAFMFSGWLSQTVMIIPSRDVVIVRLGFSDAGDFQPYFDDIAARILGAL
ncbi:MAG: serine hydrolase [Pseudomonadota bacterium]